MKSNAQFRQATLRTEPGERAGKRESRCRSGKGSSLSVMDSGGSERIGCDRAVLTHRNPESPAREDETSGVLRKASRLLVEAVRLRLGQGSLGHPCNPAI